MKKQRRNVGGGEQRTCSEIWRIMKGGGIDNDNMQRNMEENVET